MGFCLLAALAATVFQPAPEREVPLVVRLDVEVVQVDAVVTDRKGRVVTDLVAADFEVLQDGRRQVVTHVAFMGRIARPVTDAPVVVNAPGEDGTEGEAAEESQEESASDPVVYVIDDLSLSVGGMDATRRALLGFADGMEAESRVFLLRTGTQAIELRPVTGPAELRAVARSLRPSTDGTMSTWDPTGARRSPFDPQPLLDPQALATSLYLNSLLARQSLLSLQGITDALRAWKGRKTLVLFSEGFPIWDPTTRSRESGRGLSPLDELYGRSQDVLDGVHRLTDLANRASVVIHAVDPRGLVPAGISAADPMTMSHDAILNVLQVRRNALHTTQESLFRLAEGTGGLAVVNSNDVGEGLARIMADRDGYYLVGYEPSRDTFSGERPRFHRLEVKVKRGGLKVRSRTGFFGLSDAAVQALAPAPSY